MPTKSSTAISSAGRVALSPLEGDPQRRAAAIREADELRLPLLVEERLHPVADLSLETLQVIVVLRTVEIADAEDPFGPELLHPDRLVGEVLPQIEIGDVV